MQFNRLQLLTALIVSTAALADGDEQDVAPPEQQLEEVTVVSPRARAMEAGMLGDTIEQTEVIDASDLVSRQATVLSEALELAPGARVNNECSMCGVKRIMLNGLGGQHTTILVDGLPAHTLLSGFYGPDALSIAGVERIEVARGAGASLTAPEAIGGIVNIVTVEPTATGVRMDLAGGEQDFGQGSLVATYANESGSLRGLGAFQFDTRDQYDGDDNGVSENPYLRNYNYSGRIGFDPTAHSTVTFRAARIESEIFGGPVLGDTAGSINQALASFDDAPSAQLFAGDDVRGRYVGKPWETTEWIETTRTELSGRYFQEFSAALNMDAGISWSDHDQDSFYEGFDYRAENEMLFFDVRLNWAPSDSHLLTVGFDRRYEELRSDSTAAAGNPAFISDSFDYETRAIFVQETWTPNDRLELAFALRFDDIDADFIDPQRPGTEISEFLVSPRIDIRYRHNDAWTSRISSGRGYRAPLSFFETDHGILDAGLGFVIDVDELERSTSVSYALSYLGERLSATASAAWTEVDNLAALDETETGVPLLTQRDDSGQIIAATLDAGYVVTDTLSLALTGELIDYDDVSRSIFAVAPIEERVTIAAEWMPAKWDIDLSMTWVGERDLRDYGYEGFNDAAGQFPKASRAPQYVTLDARIEREWKRGLSFYLGGRNLTDYTQVEDEGSPLFFDADGAYDVAYIYGPLRGRVVYGGMRMEF